MAESGRDVLVVMALPGESQGLFERAGVSVLYTGIGKVNAAIALTRRLAQYGPAGGDLPLVVNFGSAGSRRFAAGTLVTCTTFGQRDMDVTGLGFEIGATPFDAMPARLEFAQTFRDLPQGTCGTGDCFVTGDAALPYDVVDMEAYALAKVCKQENARFACAKYVTDGADHAAASDWQSNVPKAAVEFLRLYRTLVQA